MAQNTERTVPIMPEQQSLCVAVIGSRGIKQADLARYLPAETAMLISGGAAGVDTLAEEYAKQHGLPIRVIRPNYALYGRKAPLLRNRQIVECADLVVALWDGSSPGTAFTVEYAHERGIPVRLYIPKEALK